jgi:hypothetical protein
MQEITLCKISLSTRTSEFLLEEMPVFEKAKSFQFINGRKTHPERRRKFIRKSDLLIPHMYSKQQTAFSDLDMYIYCRMFDVNRAKQILYDKILDKFQDIAMSYTELKNKVDRIKI